MNTANRKRLTTLTLSICLGAALSACAPVMVGSFAMGTMVAVDRRTAGTQVEDQGIEVRGANRIQDYLGERGHVNITSYNRQVLLTGEVPSVQDKQQVEQVATKVENVRSVVNELEVMGTTSLMQRSADSLVTGKIKASLVDAKDLYATAFKVVTEHGTAYLMGRVTQREADRATEIARSIDGVKKVVRILDIISEEELKALTNK